MVKVLLSLEAVGAPDICTQGTELLDKKASLQLLPPSPHFESRKVPEQLVLSVLVVTVLTVIASENVKRTLVSSLIVLGEDPRFAEIHDMFLSTTSQV